VIFKRFLSAITVSLLSLAVPERLFAQTAATNSRDHKSSAETYHNVQVLKDLPANELIPAMQFITYSLGVECSYCHVEGALEKDDKETKLTARKMMRMVFAVNRDNFDSKQVVTCNSCHRGAPRPVAIPLIAGSGISTSTATPTETETSVKPPSPDEVITKYVSAVGGADALARVKTREEKGTIDISGRKLPIEILIGTGGKQLTIIHLANGDSITACDGITGWTSAPSRPANPVPRNECISARSETELQLPIHMKQLFDQLESMPSENIGDRLTYVVAGINEGEIGAKFYFDKDSGYLLRILRYTKPSWDKVLLKLTVRITVIRTDSRFRSSK
jgi:photosynthetic reaction center cytochrome c subunit